MQGDDWAWGSHIGLERLSNSFRNYNGRYLGNLLILALSRSHFLNAVAFALVLTLLIYLMQKAGTGLFRSTCLFIPLLFFLMPSTMFRQVFSWASGFVNYVPSMVFVLLFLVIIRRSMQPDAPALTVWRAAFILVTGFAGQLFVEHVTLYMVAASLLMLLVCSLIKKKLHVESLLYAISCIAGAAFMFTNGAYLNAITSPGYQEIPSFSLTGWLRDAFHVFIDQISDLLVWDNIVLNLFIALLCLVLLMKTKETKASRRILRDLFASGFVFFIAYQVYLTTGLQLLGAYQKYISQRHRRNCLFCSVGSNRAVLYKQQRDQVVHHFLLRFHPSNHCASVYRQTDWTPLLLCSLCLSGPYFLRILAIWPGSRHALSDRPSAHRTGRVRSGCRSALLFQNLLNCMGGFPAAACLYRQPIPAG